MRIRRALVSCLALVAVGTVLVSGGSDGDPRTPAALPGLPPPFLGTAVTGDGGLTAAIDAYGDVVDLRPEPAGPALIDDPSARQAAGTVPAGTGIVPRISVDGSPPLPAWRGEGVTQRYRRGTNVVETIARVRGAKLITLTAAAGDSLAIEMTAGASGAGRPRPGDSGGAGRVKPTVSVDVEDGVHCAQARHRNALDLLCRSGGRLPVGDGESRSLLRECDRIVRAATGDAHRWLAASTPLGETRTQEGGPPGGRRVPAWARSMYRRSLLTIRALTSRATGAVAAGARDGWAYVWPRDAATAALALADSGHRAEARHVTRFLTGLDLAAAARFTGSGAPVPGRAAQGDASGWVTAAAKATGVPPPPALPWRDRADYQESTLGTYLANALSHVDGPKTRHIGKFSARQRQVVRRIEREFGTPRGLVRTAGDPGSGLDSAAAWAVRPFHLRPLYRDAEETMLRLAHQGTPFGITPGEGWNGGPDPWSAPTAWTAWSLASLADESEPTKTDGRDPRTNLKAVRERGGPSRPSPRLRQASIALLKDLRRSATPAGALPERVDLHSGIPTSTTPLLWSSAFTVLALRELWP